MTPERAWVQPTLLILLLGLGLQLTSLFIRLFMLGDSALALIVTTASLSALAGATAIALPRSGLGALRDLGRRIEDSPAGSGWFVALSSLLVFSANVFLQQPNAWDEPGLLTAAPAIGERGLRGLAQVYQGNAWIRQHPPLAAVVYGAAWSLGATGPHALRFVSVAFGCAALVVAWRIVCALHGRRCGLLVAALLLTCPLVVRLCSAVGNDAALLFFFWLAILCGLRLVRAPSPARALVLGLVLGLGLVTKYTMVLVAPILVSLPWALRKSWPSPGQLAISLSIPLALAAAWAWAVLELGILDRHQSAISHIATVTLRSGWRYPLLVLLVQVPSAIGIYAMPALVVGLWSLRSNRRRVETLSFLWVAAVFLPVTLTSPSSRFYVPAFPAVAMITATGLLRGSGIDSVRVALLFAALCGVTLLYYGWVDLTVLLRPF